MADETEQQLREKVAAQKGLIANLAPLRSIIDETGLTSPETKARAQLIKELSDNEEQLELLIESKRVAAVIRLQDELHPPVHSEDCPICLETIKYVNSTTIGRLFCCGGWICKQCCDERNKDEEEGLADKLRGKCPLCREEMPDANDHKKTITITMNNANKGRAWAQANIGTWYLNGKHDFALDKEKGMQFIKQAADQRYPDALLQMAFAYSGETLERDEPKYMYYLKEAADLGQRDAHLELALTYSTHENEKHVYYTTLAASQGDPNACSMLGQYFMTGDCGLTKSLILAKHYSEKSLEEYEESNLVSFSACNFSSVLLELGLDRYEGIMDIPGHSPIPKALFWARKSLELANDSFPLRDNAIKFISTLENQAKNHCTNCRKEAEGSSFKRCVRCLGAWYCGKECQVQHWKAGHKLDCIKRK